MRQALLILAVAPTLVGAAARDETSFQVVPHARWCDEDHGWDHDKARYCEVRASTFRPAGRLRLDASPNGGIEARGWSRAEVELRAKVVTIAETETDARELAAAV